MSRLTPGKSLILDVVFVDDNSAARACPLSIRPAPRSAPSMHPAALVSPDQAPAPRRRPGARPGPLAGTPRRAALLLRVSTDEQTIETQRPDVEQLARTRGFDLVAVYEEQASGAAKRRSVLRAMLDATHRGAFEVVIVWALDRLGRSMFETIETVRTLDRAGVEVLSVREPWLDTAGPGALAIALDLRVGRGLRTRAARGADDRWHGAGAARGQADRPA